MMTIHEKSDHLNDLGNLHFIFSALEFAATKHQFQKRKGAAGIPYINHPIEVAALLNKKISNPSVDLLIAAILHDVIEDTDAKKEDIQNKFGKKVLGIVLEVTDDMRLPSIKRKALQIQHAKDLSYEARCIKIADKTCNIRDILFTRIKWSRKRKIKYIRWAIHVVNEIRDTHPELIEEFDRIIKQSEEMLEIAW
jgi:GTP diphosphokinase / guanosine-3',5'-bis(diphosphate) 3'-diphosphatase